MNVVETTKAAERCRTPSALRFSRSSKLALVLPCERVRRIPPLCLLAFLGAAGCRTAPPLAPVNLKEPGWTMHEGQAVWRPNRAAPEMAGEILVATHPNGGAFVLFTKAPFPFVIARTEANTWEIEMPTRNIRYSGRGQPPARVLWLQLPRVLTGASPPKGWSWQAPRDRHWRLENVSTGEFL